MESASSSEGASIHDKVLMLRDVALGVNKQPKVTPSLTWGCYDSTVDSLLALHDECNQATGLSRNRNVTRFLGKYKGTVEALKELRVGAGNFEMVAIIGRGHFGEVQVVQEKSTKEVYAMKIMRKAHILQQADSACFSEERDIMAWAHSPWLTCLHYAFQDTSHLYLVMDYHPGGDLFGVIERREEGMSEKEARFYVSEIAAALNDLHQLGFVHRDVKPENVLISRSGHIKLVDFGSAARLGEGGKVVDSPLPVGTPEYIAPEVLTSLDHTGTVYGVSCDWWSLGIIAYELVCVHTPFEGDSTTMTYGNIMNYKERLSFPEDVSCSREFQGLVKRLLTEPEKRPSFAQLKKHSFFSAVNWDNLLAALPPFIPNISSPSDTSYFDSFEPEKEDLSAGLPTRPHKEFSGKSLPFVGFTFTRLSHSQLEFTDSDTRLSKSVSKKEGKQLAVNRGELKELRERNQSLEKECVVFQNQLKDIHHQLERERADRRQSDAKAMKLLEEIKLHNETLRELRKEELSDTSVQLNLVVTQLEQDRQVVSNKARRLQTELENVSKERDMAVQVAVELKAKLKALKESSKKDIASLQSRLSQMRSSTQSTSVQEKLTDAVEQYVTANKKLKAMQEIEKEQKSKIKKLETAVASHTAEVKELKSKLESVKAEHADQRRELESKVDSLLSEKSMALQECEELKQSNKELQAELSEATTKFTTREEEKVKSESEVVSGLQEEVRSLQRKLSETGETAIRQSERLREERALKRTLDLENSELKSKLKKTEAARERLQEELNKKSEELEGLYQLETKLVQTELELTSEQESKKATIGKLENLKAENNQLLSQKKKMDIEQQSLSDKLSTEELSAALVQRKLKLVEEELAECKASVEELTAAESQWKAVKVTMASDLETAESRLDDIQDSIEKEKIARTAAEKKQEELLLTLDKIQSSHHQEVKSLQEQLASQSDLLAQSDKKALEAEKELKLMEVTLRQTQKDLDTEKACYSKTYEELYTLQRDYRILKAAYNKLCRECDEQHAELTHTTEVRDRALNEQKSAAEARHIQETRMQSTIEQQNKLIDYLQGVGVSPRSSSALSKLAKGLRLGRKGRDPVKEIAEWNKLKGLLGKPQKSAKLNTSQASVASQVSVHSSSTVSLSTPPSTEVTSTPLPRSTRKGKTTPRTASPDSGSKVAQSTVLNFPVASLPKRHTRQASRNSESGSLTSLSVEVVKENVAISGNIVGKKRKHQENMSNAESDLLEPAEKVLSVRHNIPHKFALHRSGFHKAYKCAACNEPIKSRQRYAKCSYCQLTCHYLCVDTFPNDCGLPAELAAHTLPPPTSTSKFPSKQEGHKKTVSQAVATDKTPSKRDNKRPLSQSMSLDKAPFMQEDKALSRSTSKEQAPKQERRKKSDSKQLNVSSANDTDDSFVDKEERRLSSPISSISGVVKIEKVTLMRSPLKTLGWLILSHTSLIFHDRDPNHGTTRKPLYSFDLASSNCIYHTLSDKIELFGCPEKQLSRIFGLRKYVDTNHDYQDVLFLAPTLESKIEWVAALNGVFASLSSNQEQLVYGDAIDGDREVRLVQRKRSLKSVSIIPVKAPRRSAGSELDLSIRSSMLGESDSNTSLV